MKKLHIVGFTPDNDGVILSPRKGAKSGGFVVALDDELISSIERARSRTEAGDQSEPVGAAGVEPAEEAAVAARRARPRSSLSPREIQARLRAGSSIAEVAASAGVDEEWVVRFAAPILAEQARVVESAQRLTLSKTRLGPSIEPLANAVQWNLTDRGVRFSHDVFSDSWSAHNLHGARWAVRFTYTSRQRRHVAEWEIDLRERSLTARNRLASDLGHVEAGRRRPRLESADEQPTEPASATVSPRETATRRNAKVAKVAKVAKARAKAAKPSKAMPSLAGSRARGASASPTGPAAKAPARKGRASAAAKKKAAANRTGRESSPRKARPSKKPEPDAPGAGSAPGGPTAADAPDLDRPSHLARPPSPMNRSNRATTFPRRVASAPRPYPPRSASPAPPAPAPAGPGPQPVRARAEDGAAAAAARDESGKRAPEERAGERPTGNGPAGETPAGEWASAPASTDPPKRSSGTRPEGPSAAAEPPPVVIPAPAAEPASRRERFRRGDRGGADQPPAATPPVVAPPLRRPPAPSDVEGPAVVILSTPGPSPSSPRSMKPAGRPAHPGGDPPAPRGQGGARGRGADPPVRVRPSTTAGSEQAPAGAGAAEQEPGGDAPGTGPAGRGARRAANG